MKKVYTLFIICTVFICNLSFCPVSAFQEDSFTDSQYEQIGSLGLGHLISDGQIDELDFSGGTGEVSFLIALGKSIVTMDPTYILDYGLNWATAKAQEVLQSLEDWFSYNFPDLYEFFTGVKTEIKYNPMPLETRRGFTQLLKDRVDSPDPVQPNPDVNYAAFLRLINGNVFFTDFYQADYWLGLYNNNSSILQSGSGTLQLVPSQYSLVKLDYNYNTNQFNNVNYQGNYISNFRNNYYNFNSSIFSEPVTIYINSVENSNNYTVTTSLIDMKGSINSNGLYFDLWGHYNPSNQEYYFSTRRIISSYETMPTFVYTGTLEQCFQIVSMNFRNVDIYVNGNLWAVGSYDPDDSIVYPIGIPDNFEILNGVQGGYYYPIDTYWNLDGLVQLIKQAISEYGVVSISDIAPLIVDINGVQAVRTTNVARTDYDNLISEQYSVYPDDTVLQVPNVVLDNGEIISFVATSSGSDLIPDDIMLVLCGGGILLLIGYMINRMLE